MRSETSNLISNISSLIIGASALFLTVWQTHAQRENNKLSVRPKLEVVSDFSLHEKEAFLRLSNTGLGPALVKQIEVYMKNKKFDANNLSPAQAIAKAIGMHEYMHCFDIDPISDNGATIPAGQQINLIYIGKAYSDRRFNNNCYTSHEALEYKSKDLKLVVHYESAYQEKFKSEFNKKSTYFSQQQTEKTE